VLRLSPTHGQGLGLNPEADARTLPPARLESFSDGVFAIAITLLVIELHVPTSKEALAAGLEHEWPRYLGYLVSFAFIGGVWIAHSNVTRFIRVVDAPLMRLNMLLLLFVSLLPFTTGVVANHLFESYLAVSNDISRSFGAERIAVVLFGVDMTMAALMLYLLIRHAARRPGLAVDDVAEDELQRFTRERRAAFVAQGSATVVGVFLPVLAVLFYLSVSVLFIVAPLAGTRWRRSKPGVS
jgi:uncharacterized membrane protein